MQELSDFVPRMIAGIPCILVFRFSISISLIRRSLCDADYANIPTSIAGRFQPAYYNPSASSLALFRKNDLMAATARAG
jgi:hypothetical protein